MSLILKGIDLPKEPWDCCCRNAEMGRCNVRGIDCDYYIPKDCPLIQIPKGHGRLIDEKEAIRGWCKECAFNDGTCGKDTTICEDKEMCKYAPTILEAEEE